MLAKLLLVLIRIYQATLSKLLFALFGPVCRFEPSCSRYAFACIQGHGALRGSLLSMKRLCKCHPFHPGGYDPPPPPRLGPKAKENQSAAAGSSHVAADRTEEDGRSFSSGVRRKPWSHGAIHAAR